MMQRPFWITGIPAPPVSYMQHTMDFSNNNAFLSGYTDTLPDKLTKQRYQEKLELIGGIDLYEISKECE